MNTKQSRQSIRLEAFNKLALQRAWQKESAQGKEAAKESFPVYVDRVCNELVQSWFTEGE